MENAKRYRSSSGEHTQHENDVLATGAEKPGEMDTQGGDTHAATCNRSRVIANNCVQQLQQQLHTVWYGIVEFNVPLDTV